MKKIFIFIFTFFLMVPTYSKGYSIGDSVKNFTLTSLDGKKKISLNNFKNKKIYLNFTTTWCPLCIKEKKKLNEDYNKFLKDNRDIVLITVFGPYRGDTIEKARNYMKEHNYSFPSYYDKGRKLATEFNVSKIPITFLIENGKVKNIYLRKYPF